MRSSGLTARRARYVGRSAADAVQQAVATAVMSTTAVRRASPLPQQQKPPRAGPRSTISPSSTAQRPPAPSAAASRLHGTASVPGPAPGAAAPPAALGAPLRRATDGRKRRAASPSGPRPDELPSSHPPTLVIRAAASGSAAEAPELIRGPRPQPPPEPCDALIVGAGPAGLGTALLLAQREGWQRIVILERREAIDAEERDRAFVYLVDARGLSVPRAAGLMPAVDQLGVVARAMNITQVHPDGTCQDFTFTGKDRPSDYALIPRRNFLLALRSGLAPLEQQGRVKLLHNMHVRHIDLGTTPTDVASAAAATATATATAAAGTTPAPPPIVVHARDAVSGREYRFAPRLLVGADGMRSEVRRALEGWAPGAGRVAADFAPVVLDSPSAGLRYKVLPLPPNPKFRITHNHHNGSRTGSEQDKRGGESGAITNGIELGTIDNARLCVVVGVDAPRTRSMRLGLWPLRNPNAPRTGNVIVPADHHFWTITSGKELGVFLQESFPQLDISALFTPMQLDEAVASRGGAFPRPQYLRHFTAVLPPPQTETTTKMPTQQQQQQQQVAGPGQGSPASSVTSTTAAAAAAAEVAAPSSSSSCGVALVGDAVHCVPPDLAQGVNCALLDVMALAQALDESGGDLGRALPLYEFRRAPEAAALAELVTFGAPYQYTQDKVRLSLWALNVRLRALLHNLAPWAFSPQTFMMLQQTGLSYEQIRRRAHATTLRIWTIAAILVAAVGTLVTKAAGILAAATVL